MQLNRLHVKGFKSFQELDLELRSLNILIGANGSGKSNLIALFRLLNEMVGGNFQNFVRQQGGAESFLYYGSKTTDRIVVNLYFGRNAYHCIWMPTADDRLFFAEETVVFFGDMVDKWESLLGTGHLESRLPEIAQVEMGRVAWYVRRALKSWVVYHFHDTSETAPVKKPGAINDNLYLRPNAANLAAFLYRLQQEHPHHYEMIRDAVRMVAPFFDDFLLRPMPGNENLIRLEWRARGSDFPFIAHHLSDGTLRFICLATLLSQPVLPATVLIDEPELGLHPYAIAILAELMRSAATRTQLIVATQSVTLVNHFEPEDLLITEMHDGTSTIRRLDAESVNVWLEEYALGELWEKNVLGGRPTR